MSPARHPQPLPEPLPRPALASGVDRVRAGDKSKKQRLV
jgi:hypothetical protein